MSKNADPDFLAKLAYFAFFPGTTEDDWHDLSDSMKGRWRIATNAARFAQIPGGTCRPLKDWVIARQVEADDKAKPGGLIIAPAAHNPPPNQAVVVASGCDLVKVGEEIMYEGGRWETRYHSFEHNGERLLCIPRDGILAIVDR